MELGILDPFGVHPFTWSLKYLIRLEFIDGVTIVLQVMYENRARLMCTAEGSPVELFEKVVTIADAKQIAPRTSRRSSKSDDSDLCVDNELGFAKDRTISR